MKTIKPKDETCIVPNSKSTIDLVFIKGHSPKILAQEVLYRDPAAVLRKHIPVATSLESEKKDLEEVPRLREKELLDPTLDDCIQLLNPLQS